MPTSSSGAATQTRRRPTVQTRRKAGLVITVNFDRDDCRELSIPVPRSQAPKGGWEGQDLLLLAGVAYGCAMIEGPRSFNPRFVPNEMRPEYAEAYMATFTVDMFAAVEWISDRLFEVCNGLYDDNFDSRHALHISGENGDVTPLNGFKPGFNLQD